MRQGQLRPPTPSHSSTYIDVLSFSCLVEVLEMLFLSLKSFGHYGGLGSYLRPMEKGLIGFLMSKAGGF